MFWFVKILLIFFGVMEGILATYLLMPFFLWILYYAKGGRKTTALSQYPITNDTNFDFAAIITAHQDVSMILPLVDSFYKQTYNNFTIYIIADDCDIKHLHFNDLRVNIIKPAKALNAKVKSIKLAVDNFIREHDVLIVFDSDNLVHPEYLKNLNEYFKRGFRAVQTHMLSKNVDSVYAKLDSIGHIYNTFVEREAKMKLKQSSSILGLGIALETNLYKEVMYKDGLGGFDKKLQADIIKKISQLAFAENAIVYDEKVDDGNTMEKQRTRWLYTYFKYFPVNWSLLITGLWKQDFKLFFFAFTALRPPLFLMVGSAIFFLVINIFLLPVVAMLWLIVLLVFTCSFILIVITESRQKGIARALFYVPIIIFRQISALLKIKKASQQFLKTEHKKIVYIDELLRNESL